MRNKQYKRVLGSFFPLECKKLFNVALGTIFISDIPFESRKKTDLSLIVKKTSLILKTEVSIFCKQIYIDIPLYHILCYV